MENSGDKVNEFNSNRYEVFRTETEVKPSESFETKAVKWKYFACALLINMILSCPVYIYGLFLAREPVADDVLPPIVFNSVYLMLTPQFFKNHSKIHRLSDRAGIVLGVIIAAAGITINGLVLSSPDPCYLIGTFCYGGLGGFGTCLTMAKVWHSLHRIYRMENLHWINGIYSTGQSLCQFIFPYTFNAFINAYGCPSAVVLMGSIVLNALPLCLILTQNNSKYRSAVERSLCKNAGAPSLTDRFSDDVVGYFENLEIEIEPDPPRQNTDETLNKQLWQNPGKQFDFIDGKMINSFGVEIMDIIEEECENDELDECSINSVLIQQRCELITIPKSGRFEKMKQWLLFRSRHLTDVFYQHVIHHVQRAFRTSNFIPLILLKSSDIYSYVLCITVLPQIAVTRYALATNEIPFLISSLAFPWAVVAVSTPFQGKTLKENQKQIFVLSGLLKIVGLFFILISTSKILLTLSSMLIGFTQGTSFFLQDEIIRSAFSQTEWKHLRSSVYFFTGFLLLIFGIVLHLGFTTFVDCLSFSLVLFTVSFVCWILFPHISNVWISFQKARK